VKPTNDNLLRLAGLAALLAGICYGVALAWLGFALLTERRTEDVVAVLPPQDQRPKAAA
jgi:hypothetical protein